MPLEAALGKIKRGSAIGAGLGVQFGSALSILAASYLKREYGIELNENEAWALFTLFATPCAILASLAGAWIRRIETSGED